MASKKITPQEMKSGNIYRCENCEKKCDDKYTITNHTFKCGQLKEGAMTYCCSTECAEYVQRENVKINYRNIIARNDYHLKAHTEVMSVCIRTGNKLFGLFEQIKHLKAENKALNLILSREATSAEIIVAFNNFRDTALALSEVLQDDKVKNATGQVAQIYGNYTPYLKLCEKMTFATQMMKYKEHHIWCVD